jgi:hypothetical protein
MASLLLSEEGDVPAGTAAELHMRIDEKRGLRPVSCVNRFIPERGQQEIPGPGQGRDVAARRAQGPH